MKKFIDRHHDKYITTPEFIKFIAEVFNARLGQANLTPKTNFDTKVISLNENINSNKIKHLLVEDELQNLILLIQLILQTKVILKKMAHKII